MAHGQLRRSDQLNSAFAQSVSDTMQASATPSRVRILGALRDGLVSVSELAEALEMAPAAVS